MGQRDPPELGYYLVPLAIGSKVGPETTQVQLTSLLTFLEVATWEQVFTATREGNFSTWQALCTGSRALCCYRPFFVLVSISLHLSSAKN